MIYKLKSYDLLVTALNVDNYYFCTDTKKLFKDTSTGRHELNAVIVSTEIERLSIVRPTNGKYYYIFETNELWLYSAGWSVVVGTVRTSNGYYYANNTITATTDISEVLDNNGLLGDGAVVVRDYNRIIKGKLYIDPENNNLIISSFLGGGFVFLPAGSMNEEGVLRIKSSVSYGGVDGNGDLTTTRYKGNLEFSGSLYEKQIESEKRSKLISIQDLYDMHIMSTTTGDVYVGTDTPSSASYRIWIDTTDESNVVMKIYDEDAEAWMEK